jgi:hypothetical protein
MAEPPGPSAAPVVGGDRRRRIEGEQPRAPDIPELPGDPDSEGPSAELRDLSDGELRGRYNAVMREVMRRRRAKDKSK